MGDRDIRWIVLVPMVVIGFGIGMAMGGPSTGAVMAAGMFVGGLAAELLIRPLVERFFDTEGGR